MTTIEKALEACAKRGAGFQIENSAELSRSKVTAFTWSAQQGTLCLATNKRYFSEAANNPNVTGIVCPRTAIIPGAIDKGLVISDDAAMIFYFLHNQAIHEGARPTGPGHGAGVPASARIAESANIGPDVQIGENVTIDENCVVRGEVRIGDNCHLHAGVIIGSDGLFSKTIFGEKTHIRHFGGVRLGKNCLVHAGTNISRSANFGEFTEIHDDVHLGIYCNIGHDCVIGKGSDISGQAMLSGRVRIGEGVNIGARAVVSNAVKVGRNSRIRIGAVVIDDVAENGDVSGNFATQHVTRLKRHMMKKRNERN